MERGEAAHRESNDMRAADAEMIEDRTDIVDRAVLRIGGSILWDVGRRKSPRVVYNTAIAPAEMPDLRFPAAMIAGELMHEDQRRSRARFLIVEADFVVGLSVRHANASDGRLY